MKSYKNKLSFMFDAIPMAIEHVVLIGVSVTKIIKVLPQNDDLKVNVVESDRALYELSRKKYDDYDNVNVISEWLLPGSDNKYSLYSCNNPRYSSLCEPRADFFENTNLSYSTELVNDGTAFDTYLKSLSLSSSTINLLLINSNGSEYSYINNNIDTLVHLFDYICVIEPRDGMYDITSKKLESELYIPICSFEYDKETVVLYHLDRRKAVLFKELENTKAKTAKLEKEIAEKSNKIIEIKDELDALNEKDVLRQKTIDDLKSEQKLYLERELKLQRKYFLLKKQNN
ncbi:hypothetical protein [Alteromonas sp. KUL49]|uniref:hypothetical protein n=1 Tax=Alteromonas sp. KUL49 TaxID=2480798 RepID=UPI00102F118F|nr:hypothetical protein [Alteromonas sp. KUL49]TAP37895.1 hypothetical protein EYS00_15465 [Alteromonas sp. KUL49]GEA12756.1 hypothetical protein KUL49_31310 [Alteromonas sp. KUL49]